jgi:hypothetical protein
VEQNEITFTMKIEVVSAPGLEMRIALGASSSCFEGASSSCFECSTAAGATCEDASVRSATAGTSVAAVGFSFFVACQHTYNVVCAVTFILDGENNLGVASTSSQRYRDTETFLDPFTLETIIAIVGEGVTDVEFEAAVLGYTVVRVCTGRFTINVRSSKSTVEVVGAGGRWK